MEARPTCAQLAAIAAKTGRECRAISPQNTFELRAATGILHRVTFRWIIVVHSRIAR